LLVLDRMARLTVPHCILYISAQHLSRVGLFFEIRARKIKS
jgi:hypothetical protein